MKSKERSVSISGPSYDDDQTFGGEVVDIYERLIKDHERQRALAASVMENLRRLR